MYGARSTQNVINDMYSVSALHIICQRTTLIESYQLFQEYQNLDQKCGFPYSVFRNITALPGM